MNTARIPVSKAGKIHNVVEFPQGTALDEMVETLGEQKVLELANRMLRTDASNWARGIPSLVSEKRLCVYKPDGNVVRGGESVDVTEFA